MEIKTYTKKDIATELSKRQNKSVRSSITIVDDIFRILKDYLTEDNPYTRIEIRNFGTFSTRKREKRISRNPKTGTSVLVEEKSHPYFRASKNLKNSLNK